MTLFRKLFFPLEESMEGSADTHHISLLYIKSAEVVETLPSVHILLEAT